MSTLTIPDNFSLEMTSGDKGSMTVNSHADLILDNPARSSSGRALVTGGGSLLIINYATDFSAGVQINGQVQVRNLVAAPPGVTTTPVCADAAGNLYKGD